MKEKIEEIFKSNIRLIEWTDKAVYYFRCQNYDKALKLAAESVEGVNTLVKAILENEDYFSMVEERSVIAMIEGILAAKKNGDFILLADIYELQLSNFISRIQELIIEREEYPYSVTIYEENMKCLTDRNRELYEYLKVPEEPKKLLDKGFSVEYSTCGLMTLAAVDKDGKFYFHSNSHVMQEAFLLAESWIEEGITSYHVYGLGLSYHLTELFRQCPDANIYIYESDFDVIRLTFNFVNLKELLLSKRVHFIFDESLDIIREAVGNALKEEKIVVHYPSFRNLKGEKLFLLKYLPWIERMEDCK